MESFVTHEYHVKNVDCATCAAKIENSLKKIEGVDNVTFDFANLILHVKATDLNRVVEEVHRIEPDVKLVPESETDKAGDSDRQFTGFKFAKELSILMLAVLLFSLELFFENWIHQQPFPHLELYILFTKSFFILI